MLLCAQSYCGKLTAMKHGCQIFKLNTSVIVCSRELSAGNLPKERHTPSGFGEYYLNVRLESHLRRLLISSLRVH